MPYPESHIPKYRKHRASGQAIVTLNGQDHYLGPHGTRASHLAYDRLILEYLSADRQAPQPAEPRLSMVELLAAYWRHCKGYYVKHGEPTQEQAAYRKIIRELRQLYGDLPVADFGPKCLKALRQLWIGKNHKRGTINDNIDRVRRIFRWAVSEELIAPDIFQALKTVPGLRKGRTEVAEGEPVLPVAMDVVERTLLELQPVVQDMIRVQLLTGMRPNEICSLRPCDVDRSLSVWEYRPEAHKMEHKSRSRVIFIGPAAQARLASYLLRDHTAPCFSPRENVQQWLEHKHERRVTDSSRGNRPGTNRQASPKRAPRDGYDTSSYRRAIHRACDLAFPAPEPLCRRNSETLKQWHSRLTPQQRLQLAVWQSAQRWSPNQLRHTAATLVRKQFGLEAAQVVLGHAAADVTQVYAERDADKAREVVRQIG